MTREEIKNTPEIVDFMLDKCVLADSRTKVGKRLEEVCDLAIKAVEQESVIAKIRAEIERYKSIIDNAISEDELKIEGMKEAYADCLEIIDKYKVERSDKI